MKIIICIHLLKRGVVKFKIPFLILFNLIFYPNFLQAQEKLIISGIKAPLTDIGEQILSEAYQRIGIQIVVERFPVERSLIQSNYGKVDGELLRIAGIEKKYTNLIMIPVSYVNFQGVVFSKKFDFPVKGWSSLKPYKIGILIGSKFAEAGTKGMRTMAVIRYEQLVMLLDMGRIDIFVESRLNGLKAFRQAKMKDFLILEPPLVELPLFHYVHKKHQALVPSITVSFKKMQEEGRFQTIRKEFEEAHLK